MSEIDPKAIEAVSNAVWNHTPSPTVLHGENTSHINDEKSEVAIHAYHSYLEGIGAKVLVPMSDRSWPAGLVVHVLVGDFRAYVELPLGEQS